MPTRPNTNNIFKIRDRIQNFDHHKIVHLRGMSDGHLDSTSQQIDKIFKKTEKRFFSFVHKQGHQEGVRRKLAIQVEDNIVPAMSCLSRISYGGYKNYYYPGASHAHQNGHSDVCGTGWNSTVRECLSNQRRERNETPGSHFQRDDHHF